MWRMDEMNDTLVDILRVLEHIEEHLAGEEE
jgi:hypothetical protein